ncbi:MAG: hypothetical protein ACM3WP_22765 [Acidobacteriota bacterium]
MSRTISSAEYVLRINLRSGSDIRRFCEVRVKGNDVYVFQPRKGEASKISYHESGQRHLKIGDGHAMFVRHDQTPRWIRDERDIWAKSFENFATLLPYRGEPADHVLELQLPDPSSESLPFSQVSIGREFKQQAWMHDDVVLTTLQSHIFDVKNFPTNIVICVRMLVLSARR